KVIEDLEEFNRNEEADQLSPEVATVLSVLKKEISQLVHSEGFKSKADAVSKKRIALKGKAHEAKRTMKEDIAFHDKPWMWGLSPFDVQVLEYQVYKGAKTVVKQQEEYFYYENIEFLLGKLKKLDLAPKTKATTPTKKEKELKHSGDVFFYHD